MNAGKLPKDLRYTKTHEWVRQEKDAICVVGNTDDAQSKLGDFVYIELPKVGTEVVIGKECCTIESVKAASDVYAPVSGLIMEVNSELERSPILMNQDPYGKGWIFKIKASNQEEFKQLLDADQFQEMRETIITEY